MDEPEMLLSIGVWGPGPGDGKEFVEFNRDVERRVHVLNGQKWLYARTYYTEEEFWAIYDRDHFDRLRQKYHATYLPTLYEKVRVRLVEEENRTPKIWPLTGLYGLLHSAIQSEYLTRRSVFNPGGGLISVIVIAVAVYAVMQWSCNIPTSHDIRNRGK